MSAGRPLLENCTVDASIPDVQYLFLVFFFEGVGDGFSDLCEIL